MEHTLTYEKGKITVDGVKKVEAFDETSARIILADNTVSFRGTGFVMVEMAQASGKMSFLGNVETISYKNKGEKTSFVKKLFK
jgi:TATA-box binding protein (TBP) (component of TFIID and TFIIIB)